MTVLEAEAGSRRRQRKPHRKQKVPGRSIGIGHNLSPPLSDDQVLTFFEWIKLNSISPRNGRRILQSGDGPRVVRLSARRIGITIRANREWQQARERV